MYDAGLLREILDAQQEMVCRFRRDGTILFVNRAYAQSLGKSPEELTHSNLWNSVTPEDRAGVEAQLDRLSPSRTEILIENRFETLAGPRWIEWRNRALAFTPDGALLIAQCSGHDITERKALQEQQELLVEELNHRVRNTLMVVQGMAYQSFKDEAMPAQPLAMFNARLHALAAAHALLSRSSWSGADLAEVVRHGLTICNDSGRVTAHGPEIMLKPNAAVALILVLHELATNAVKYGALSADRGLVDIGWARVAGALELTWVERGGPPVVVPTRSGFGSRLIRNSVANQLGGELTLDFAPYGLSCVMRFPLGLPTSIEVAA